MAPRAEPQRSAPHARRRRALNAVFPFLEWVPQIDGRTLRADLIAGLTVALVLIPQSMAYAQLAGLPAYFGLYAALVPPSIAALFGSSRQLATGPVAVVSLLTAAAILPLASAGSPAFVAYAIMMAVMVGAFQLVLGILRLGIAVAFLSHPVVNGFTNAAAIIIATSQLGKIFGVEVASSGHYFKGVYDVLKNAVHHTNWSTLGMAALAFVIMYTLKVTHPRAPNVLVAVVATTALSAALGYQRSCTIGICSIASPEAKAAILDYNARLRDARTASQQLADAERASEDVERVHGTHSTVALTAEHEAELLRHHFGKLRERADRLRSELRSKRFVAATAPNGDREFHLSEHAPPSAENSRSWRLDVKSTAVDEHSVSLISGGSVVGTVPRGLPTFRLPEFDPRSALQLLPMAAIISLMGFMEAISIAKAMAARTGQRLDPNQELIGQGLANMVGALSSSYPTSGSFSRSAVNIQAGALTGLSSVITSLVVVLTLAFFTPLLYHLPQAVLAAIIMMAVVGLLDVKGFVHAWHAQKFDGAISVLTFSTTLVFAPHLEKGILVGVGLSVFLYLSRNLKPSVAIVSLHPDQSLRDATRHDLRRCRHIAAIRFDGPLFFVNANYLEDKILEQVAAMPELRHVLIIAHGINELDASGEATLALLVTRLRDAGYDVSFSGMKDQVIDVLKRTDLYATIGDDHLFPTQAAAIAAIHAPAHENSSEAICPLLEVCPRKTSEVTHSP